MKRTIAIFTGNRAEYGLQKPIINAIKNDPRFDYKLIVSGAHLDKNFGKTIDEIEKDGIEIYAEAKISALEDDSAFTSLSIGHAIIEISNILDELKPDIFIVYADRFEGLAAMIASTQMNIPTAHVEGGDLTEGGALDDSVRHAMTKLAHFHFTTNEDSTSRILKMGEEPWRVHTVGFPAIDLIKAGDFDSQEQIIDKFKLNLQKPIILFTQHPVTTEPQDAKLQIRESLSALEAIWEEGAQLILTYPNNDMGSSEIIEELQNFHSAHMDNTWLSPSLGRRTYHGVLALASNQDNLVVCVGNSSSGIKETPAFGCPTVNIGSRQESRLRSVNVIDAGYSSEQILAALHKAIYDKEFRRTAASCENPYFLGGASKRIAEILATEELGTKALRKKMTY